MRYGFIVRDSEGQLLPSSFTFDRQHEGLDKVSKDDPNLPWMIPDCIIPDIEQKGWTWAIVPEDDIPAEVIRWDCLTEGCEATHCRVCGHHYDPYCGRGNICDACIIGQAADECEAVTQDFGGNYEEAARYMGW